MGARPPAQLNECWYQIVDTQIVYSKGAVFGNPTPTNPSFRYQERAYDVYTYLGRHINDCLDVNFRAEWYDDVDGGGYAGGFGIPNTTYWEVTVGPDYHPTKWLQIRPELRYDFANHANFGPANDLKKDQSEHGDRGPVQVLSRRSAPSRCRPTRAGVAIRADDKMPAYAARSRRIRVGTWFRCRTPACRRLAPQQAIASLIRAAIFDRSPRSSMIANEIRSQAVAGLTTPQFSEARLRIVWPTVAANFAFASLGKTLIRTILLAPLGWIVMAWAYFSKVLPFVGRRYLLTNRRVVIQKGWSHKSGGEVALAQIDSIRSGPRLQQRVLPLRDRRDPARRKDRPDPPRRPRTGSVQARRPQCVRRLGAGLVEEGDSVHSGVDVNHFG